MQQKADLDVSVRHKSTAKLDDPAHKNSSEKLTQPAIVSKATESQVTQTWRYKKQRITLRTTIVTGNADGD